MTKYREFPPSLVPNANRMVLTSPSFNFTSSFTGAQQNVYHPGARWTLSMTFPDLPDYKARILSAFLNGMQGRVEPIKVKDHSRKGIPAMGSPAVSGDGQTGRKLLTMGWIPNAKVLSIGDYFTVNYELKECSAEIWSDGNGLATLEFNPPLRKRPPNSALVETENPYMIATLDTDGVGVDNAPGRFSKFEEISFIEAIYK